MPGYTENRIVIFRDFDHVFDLTNCVDLWPKLFTEYQSAEILEKEGNKIKFRLSTFPEEGRPARTWISTRTLYKEKRLAIAQRLEPTFPFNYMNIRWEYEQLPKEVGIVMTWIQEFDVHPECKFNVEQMESYLNKNTFKQIRAVKENTEKWTELF